ncbi:hypothetical protein SCLCIDRAFT_34192 [Scleroderma citrinum Foug A]|uniref:Uncharacterized protein n=1 Tax=Scleroderma citrinum Foug A TaxID=1036808 RepID=A0A0C3CPL7_9AGAM|nr:hypothetical protein SCLCIDRAFT_34192 [Scleroderma citrinum Foug A]
MPGCNHPFKNWSPGHSEQDHGSSTIPSVTECIADHDGLQDDGPHDFNHGTTSDQELDGMITEFIGPGNKVYHNYHVGLNARRCDSQGHFLPDDASLPHRVQGSPDDWAPYRNRLEFKLAKFLFKCAEMLANQIDTLLEIWAASLLELGGNPLFTNHTDLYHVIDSMSDEPDEQDEVIELAGQDGQDGQDESEAPWMFNVYDVWYQDPRQVIHNLLGCTDIKDEMDFIPYREFNATNNERHWEDFMLGYWAWDEADKIISDNPSTARVTLVPIILGSDKTTVSIATGQTDYYPLYLSIGNVHNTTRRAHCDVVVLIVFLAMPKTTREHANTRAFHKFKKQLFHSSLACILRSLGAAMTIPETILFGDQYCQHVIYVLAAYIADYEEQNLDKDSLWHQCEHTELIIRELDPQTLWEEYGIDKDIVPFTSEFPRADIQRMLSPDILHQLIKGGFKDHLVDWVEKYLIHTHGKCAAEKILDDIDRRIAAVAPFTGL